MLNECKCMSGKPVNKLPLDQRVLGFIQEHHLIATGQTLLVAVSGGQDSVCLLHVLHELQPELGIKLHVAHLDHQLRGKESAGDARYVAGLAKTPGHPGHHRQTRCPCVSKKTRTFLGRSGARSQIPIF